VTADKRQVLTLLAAAQAEDHTLFQAHLRWLAGRSGVTNCRLPFTRSPPRSRSTTFLWRSPTRACPQPATGYARLSDIRPSERPSLFRRISAANAAQCASIEAKMPKCRLKNRPDGIRH
jgi:hypothetical protein